MEGIGDATLVEPLRDRSCTLENEGVLPIAVVGVSAAQPLVDQNGQLQLIGHPNGTVQGRVFMIPDRVVHPVEDKFAAFVRGSAVQDPRPLEKVLGQRIQ
jgi:hypothetical protein